MKKISVGLSVLLFVDSLARRCFLVSRRMTWMDCPSARYG